MVDYTGDYGYGHSRMNDSLAMIDGQPRMINSIGPDGSVSFSGLREDLQGMAMLDDMNSTELPLGFINNSYRMLYAVRRPSRQWRQGLRKSSLFDLISYNSITLGTMGLSETLMNIFPGVKDCIEMIECGEREAVAFCNKYAIGNKVMNNSYKLRHRNFEVGSISLSKFNIPSFTLGDKFKFLQEEVEKVVKNV